MALERFQTAQVAWKDDDSMVTDADIEIQAWLDEQIGEAFPEDGLLGEEGLPGGPRLLDADHVWVLDPIDGTNNFGRGMPGFCVSGEPLAFLAGDPLGHEQSLLNLGA
jgi:myo-inositol-1(or 4)-monophosphatase